MSNPQTEQILQAIFSVRASREVTTAIAAAVDGLPGSQFAGEFNDYITADRRPQFSPSLKNATGCVALIDCDENPSLALETMERLQLIFTPKLNIVAVASHQDAEFLLRAMRAGCNEFLSKPVDKAQLVTALTRFQNGHLAAALTTNNRGKIISFFGVKGGVGSTTLAVHLATHLVRKHRKKVLLIDHKHELGHIALYLGIRESMYYFEELIRNVDRLDADLLEGFVTRHTSGLEIIPSPDNCAAPHGNTDGAIERVMDYLRHQYDYVLIDSSMQYSNTIAAIMSASDEVSLICTPDVAALRDLARHIEHLSLMDGFTGRLKVVINRSTSDDAVNAAQIESVVRFPVTLAIPNNFADLMRAINAGEPISPQHRGGFAQAMAKWANRLVSGTTPTVPQVETSPRFRFWK